MEDISETHQDISKIDGVISEIHEAISKIDKEISEIDEDISKIHGDIRYKIYINIYQRYKKI